MNYALLIILATAAFVVSPAFSSFTGFSESQLPIPQIDPPIQPAGYAFAIWGLIYAWLVVSAVFGLWKRENDPAWDRARPFLLLSLTVGAPWLYIATQSAIWATLLIVVMTVAAIAALLAAPKDRDRWTFQAPVAIYAGWLTAASFVSLASTLAGYGVLFDSLGWAYVGIISALFISILVFWRRKTAPEYLLTVIWALVGIIVANQTGSEDIAMLAKVGIVVLLLTLMGGRSIYPRRPAF